MSQAARISLCWPFCCFIALASAASTAFAQDHPPSNPDAASTPKPTVVTETCTSGGCHVSILKHRVMHGPVAAQQCLDCHRYDDAKRHQFKKLISPAQGCTNCHDMKLKKVVHAPVEHGSCTTCHEPHGSEYRDLLRADPAQALCRTCHRRGDDGEKKFVHTVLTMGPCGLCHEAHSADQPRLLKQDARQLCVTCHRPVLPIPGETVSAHPPARDDCIACHDPHASKYKYELKASAPGLCLSCHKNVKEQLAAAPVVHGAMNDEKSCLACHVSHTSKLPKLQRELQPQQCLNCHDRTLLTPGGRTIANIAALLQENPEHHGPIRLGACTACHQPHGGNNDKLLSAPYPPEFYAPFSVDRYQLCFTCHNKDLALVPDATAPTGFKNGEKNLHWLHVNQEKGRTCRACHEVHASKLPFHISASVPFGPNGWQIKIEYQRSANGGTCLAGCHGPKSYDHGDRPESLSVVALTPKGKSLLASETPRATTAPVLGSADRPSYAVPAPPFSAGVFPCSACHDPTLPVNAQRRVLGKPHQDIQLHHDEEHRWCLDCHNAQNRDVLRSASGEPIPFAESYRLCGQCHGTQYRDWKVGVHGKRTGEWNGRKDYLLCVHCHNPHSPKFQSIKPLPPPVRPTPDR